MSNLLPETYLKQLLRDFRGRFILVGSLLSIAAALVAALALAPGFIMLYTTQPGSVPAASASEQSKKDLVEVGSVQLLMQQYAPLLGLSSTTDALFQALSVRPENIRIDHISYQLGNPSVYVLTGVAGSRVAINQYREALVRNIRFQSVSVPVGDLVGAQGGRFKVTLLGDF